MLWNKKAASAVESEGTGTQSGDVAVEIKRERRKILSVLREDWIKRKPRSSASSPPANAEQLAAELDAFVEPARKRCLLLFPFMKWAPKRIMFELVVVAVVETHTADPDELKKATAMLKMKYNREN